MLPILICSLLVVAVAYDRFVSLKRSRVLPQKVVDEVVVWAEMEVLDDQHLETLRKQSAFGRIVATGLSNRHNSREIIRESVEDTGRFVAHQLVRHLDLLGTIGMIAPVLGLLGTVFGMIGVFEAVAIHGVGNPLVLAGGISEALITTAAGLTVALPAIVLHRYLNNRVKTLVVEMEQQAVKLVDVLSRQRAAEAESPSEVELAS